MSTTWNTREELMFLILTLHRDGLSYRAIAHTLGVRYMTVRRRLMVDESARRPRAHDPIVCAPSTSSSEEDTE